MGNLVVNKAVLTVAADNQTVAFGGSLAPYTASITGFVNGDSTSVVTGAASLSTIPATPTAAGTYPITAAQGTLAAANYSFAFVPGTLTITKINPTVTWANPAGIVYGTALSGTQLKATASVPGTFTYTPALGSLPAAGIDTLSVTFKPTDTTDYHTVTQTVQIVVSQATPPITWATPSPITYGTALSAIQLNATSTVVGTFVYTPASGTVPTAGTATLSVTFTPTDMVDYAPVTKTVSLIVNQAAPVVTWNSPAAITYGTVLSATQLNATA
jgi:MBG domain (YGX type)